MSILDTNTLLQREILTPSENTLERFGFEREWRDTYSYYVKKDARTRVSILRLHISDDGKISVGYIGASLKSHIIHFEDELEDALNKSREYHKEFNPYKLHTFFER